MRFTASTVRGLLLATLCLAAVGCGMPDTRQPVDSFEIDFAMPEGSEVSGAIVFIVDGLNGEIFEQMLDEGKLPNFKRYFIDRGLYVRRAAANVPGVTIANLVSLATGRFTGHHGVTGVNWFDRNQLIWRNYDTIAQKNTPDGDYQVANLYEQFPQRTTISVFFQPHRGTTKFIENWTSAGPLFFFRMFHQTDRLTLYRFHLVHEIAAARKEWPAITAVYLLSPDFLGYAHGATSAEYREAICHSDYQIGRVLGDLEQAGLLEKLHLALVSDHGMLDVKRHFVLDEFLQEKLHFVLPRKRLWEDDAFEKRLDYYRDYRIVTYGSGDRYWAIQLRRPIRQDGRFVGYADWLERPTPYDLEHYANEKGQINLLDRLVEQEPVDAVAWSAGPDAVRIRRKTGEVEFRQAGGREGPIVYSVIRGDDPLGYDSAVPEAARTDGLQSRQWLEATVGTDYPDLPAQLIAYFRGRRAGDIAVFAAEGWDFRNEHTGGHGGLQPGEMLVPLVVAGPGIPRRTIDAGRTVDLVPTLLRALGKPLIDGLDGVPLSDEPRK